MHSPSKIAQMQHGRARQKGKLGGKPPTCTGELPRDMPGREVLLRHLWNGHLSLACLVWQSQVAAGKHAPDKKVSGAQHQACNRCGQDCADRSAARVHGWQCSA